VAIKSPTVTVPKTPQSKTASDQLQRRSGKQTSEAAGSKGPGAATITETATNHEAVSRTETRSSKNLDSPGPDSPVPDSPVPDSPVRQSRPTSQATGEETRVKIIDAAIEALNLQGITGASARAIARVGNFNQALIFYHFGSVEGLLVAAARTEGQARAARYAERFAEVRTLSELVTIARAVHEVEQAAGSVNVLTQMLAGAASSPMLRAGVFDAMTPWLELVEQAIERVIGDSGLGPLVPIADIAFAVASLFIGLELMTALDQSGERATSLFDSIEKLSKLFSMLLPGAGPSVAKLGSDAKST
jgi:AcrR family transcriptional regulator